MLRAAALALLALFPASASAAGAAPLHSGTTRLTFDKAFGLALVQQGVDAYPVAPAEQDSLDFTLGVSGGKVKGRRARIRHRGGFRMEDKADHVEIALRDLELQITGKRVRLLGLASIGGITYDDFAFATGTASNVRRTSHSISARVTLRLNGIAVSALNSQLATNAFQEGQLLGRGRVSAR
jgi:hypothetical protein